MSENIRHLSKRQGLDQNLFEKFSKTLKNQADDSSAQIRELAREALMGESNIYGAASFYDFLQGENANKKAYVCHGSSCLCAGNQAEISKSLQQKFKSEEIGHVNCLGRCHENHAFQINGRNYSGVDIQHLEDITKEQFQSQERFQGQSLLDEPILLETVSDPESYYETLMQLIQHQSVDHVLDEIKSSGLRGRGGAGFPTGLKWQSCANAQDSEKYVVCNADEGDPGAFSDRYLLEKHPHSLLFGMLTAAWVTKARYAIIYIRDEYPESIAACHRAIEEFEHLHLPCFDDWNFSFRIIRGAGAYICGEETALLNSIEGQRPVVSVRPPFPTEKGLFGKPTILNNVETFCAIHYILQKGSNAYQSIGTEKSTGTKLVSLDSGFKQPGVYEVPMGFSLKKLIEEIGGGFSRPAKAIHIGGPLGGLVPISELDHLTIDFESFQQRGFLLGHASMIAIPQSMPMIHYLRHLFAFTAEESCGKCFPCRLGATRGVEMFDDAINQTRKIPLTLLQDLLDTMAQGSLCALGGGVPLPIKNALQWFAEELEPWLAQAENERGNTIGVTKL